MVLAGSGVDHAELVRLAEPLLAAAPRGGAATGEPKSSYVGGDWRWVGEWVGGRAAAAFERPVLCVL